MNIERRVTEDLKEILRSRGRAERDRYVRNLRDWLYTESKRVQDEQMGALLREENHHVYNSNIKIEEFKWSEEI